MSVTDPEPPAPGVRADAAQEALHDRIAADSLTTRRDYLRIVATVSGGLAVGGIGVASGILHRHGDSEGVPPLKKVADRIEPGESLAFRYPGDEDRAIAVRMEDGTLAGYSAVCTHLACAVLWRKERGSEGELYCPCHEGVFDARTGEVTAGPPPRGLPKVILVEQPDGSVWAVGTARSGESLQEGYCRERGAGGPLCARLEDGAPEAPGRPERSERT
ncbi:ubiquinol-cytochrome c reductase iron-sulfur subunit [Streptomyces sp. TLI_105]|uniref:QcrA and Rieske domain-containing protein n=1 Tax=Streptomyces sp. TLI_105 TaxID=1881019 RepID=UPI00089ACFCE|nr:Rieske (2Fe-2S) protein [Streptomyces sp. TLI_105]SED19137.1 Rieske Fe-S protein [Streptomyces sp. TLI_105]